jgi:hypothetical protein
MSVALRSSLVGLTMLLSMAGAHAQVSRGNDTGGIIPWSCENEAVAQQVAADFCAYYGKFARITSVHRMYGDYIGFNCLWRPDIARYAMPAVRTRTTCYAQAREPRLYPRVRARY